MSSLHEIKSISFGVYNSDEIKDISVCEVNNTKKSGINSVYDPRMGTTHSTHNCQTCNEDASKCPGHFGHIKLSVPILHPLFYKHILNILHCVCFKCFRSLLTEEQLLLNNISSRTGYKRFLCVLEKCKKINVCCHEDCLTEQPKLKFCTINNIIFMTNDKNENNRIELTTEEINNIFCNISNEDVELLGLNPKLSHPKSFIIHNLPVIPPMDRPYVKVNGNIWDDDLTVQYIEIIKINNQLQQLLTQSTDSDFTKKTKLVNSLKFRILTTFNNSQCKAKHTTNARPIKAIKERLTGKDGQIRNNMMGKRSNHSARTVIGPDPTLKSEEIMIPIEMAKILTVPVMVTSFNKDYLQTLIDKGQVKTLIKPDGKTCINIKRYRMGTRVKFGDVIYRNNSSFVVNNHEHIVKKGDRIKRNGTFLEKVSIANRPYKLEIGMKVNRYIQDGDFVLLNRQPTLHKGSMMAMKVLIRDKKTIRMNLAVCKSFNADFDGDEMNIHVPQGIEAQTELKFLSSAKCNIISPQSSKSNMAIVQDSLLGAYKMTLGFEKITPTQFYSILMSLDLKHVNIEKRIQTIRKTLKSKGKKAQVYNGKGIISMFLPDDLNFEYKNNACSEEPIIKIQNGVLYEGTIDKNVIGSSHVSLIHIINKEYDSDKAMHFIDCVQFSATNWLLIKGFTVGFGDCLVTSQDKQKEIKQVIQKCFMEAEGIKTTTIHPGVREMRINAVLNKAKDVGLRIAKESLDKNNNFLSTVKSGSKGDFFNIAQITGLLGQQNLKGRRVELSLNNGERSLPHYPFGKLTPDLEYESRGFIFSSFINGLNPKEFFFHAMSGREGITDTAMGTATSGYIQRRIVKLTEDIKVNYDGTVRDATNKIYQNIYGGDGFDPIMTTKVDGKQEPCNVARLVDRLNCKVK